MSGSSASLVPMTDNAHFLLITTMFATGLTLLGLAMYGATPI